LQTVTHRPLYGLLLSEAVSLTGSRMSMVAIPWFVLTTTGSVTKTGLVAGAEMAPMVVAKVLGGPLIDRLGARRVAISCDLLSGVVVGLVPLLHVLGVLGFPMLLLLVALAGALRGPGDAAKHALVPAVARSTGQPLERVTGLSSTVDRGSSFVGFALAGALVVAVGSAGALAVDAASFVLSALVLAWARVGAGHAETDTDETGVAPEGYWQQLRTGWSFLRREPVLLSLSLMIAVSNLFDLAFASVLVPVWGKETGAGAGAVGAYFAVFAAASAAGSLVAAGWGARIPRLRTYVCAFLLTGLPRFLVLAFDSPLGLLIAVTVVSGFASGFLNPIIGAVFFERIPTELVGRVSSLSTAMCFALMPLGGPLGAALVTGMGLSAALVTLGVAYWVTTLVPAVLPSFRGMNERPPRPEPVPEASGA
jgi:MFS family permease